jgi:isochorismate synthase EntC
MRLLSSHDEQQLMQALQGAQESARRTSRKCIAGFQRSIADLDFLAVFAAADQEERFFGQRPNRHQAFVALGCAAQIIAEDRERFAICSREATQLFKGALPLTTLPLPWILPGRVFPPLASYCLNY